MFNNISTTLYIVAVNFILYVEETGASSVPGSHLQILSRPVVLSTSRHGQGYN
jgi:hypothetical protein